MPKYSLEPRTIAAYDTLVSGNASLSATTMLNVPHKRILVLDKDESTPHMSS